MDLCDQRSTEEYAKEYKELVDDGISSIKDMLILIGFTDIAIAHTELPEYICTQFMKETDSDKEGMEEFKQITVYYNIQSTQGSFGIGLVLAGFVLVDITGSGLASKDIMLNLKEAIGQGGIRIDTTQTFFITVQSELVINALFRELVKKKLA